MSFARDPNIDKHSEKKLRFYADAFRQQAISLRRQADELDAKAVRYQRRANQMTEKQNGGA